MSKRIPIILGLVFVIISIWVMLRPTPFIRQFMERLDHLGYDIHLRTRVLTNKRVPETPIAIIDIDDKSLDAEGRWPWPRDKLAELVDRLNEYGAQVIAFDVFFSEEQSNLVGTLIRELEERKIIQGEVIDFLKTQEEKFNEDQIFADSLKRTDSVLAISFLPRPQKTNLLPEPLLTLSKQMLQQLEIRQQKGFISNIPILQTAAKGSGFINIFPDNDGIIRRSPLLLAYEDGLYPALSLEAVLRFLQMDVRLITPTYGEDKVLEGINIGGVTIATDAMGQVLIPFIGRSYTFPYYSATDVLNQRLPKEALRGKILFIGTSATATGDLKATAIQNPFPGVEIQATLANGLLLNEFSYQPAWTYGANLVITLIAGLLAAFLFPFLGPKILGLIIIFLPPGILLINNYIWQETGLVLSLLMPALLTLVIAIVNIIYGYLFETRRREEIKAMFGQYVPETHIDEMLKFKGTYGLRGEDREMTVLFADIRHFTSISEKLSAAELVDFLNTLFTPLTEIIFKNQGTIDKYVGDLIMAFWGAPLTDEIHRAHALRAAIEMKTKVEEMQAAFAPKNLPHISLGIGLNSGVMSVGDMGSKYRRNYTVLGDAVNLASRVESLTKFYGVSIIATEDTIQQNHQILYRELDKVRVKGKQHSIKIFEVIGFLDQLDEPLREELKTYHEALKLYYARDFDAANRIFAKLLEKNPQSKLYQIYYDRLQSFMTAPPSSDWDGTFIHMKK